MTRLEKKSFGALFFTTQIMLKFKEGQSMLGIDPTIQALQFTQIIHKLSLPKDMEGKAWDKIKIESAESEYKRFLTLIFRYPNQKFVPNKLMDEFWHMHILDTAAYRRDCKSIFGCFVDHYPYYGLNGKLDKMSLDKDFQKTKKFYMLNFGIEMDRDDLAARCGDDHACHAETGCACRVETACKN